MDEENPTIKFTLTHELEGVVPTPMPASSELPRWFRELKPDVDIAVDQFPVGTAKRCMPLLDAFSAGYYIPLPIATRVWTGEEGEFNFSWGESNIYHPVEGHGGEQVAGAGIAAAHKWINPWQISTPPGYSCLFTTPVNRPELPFECFTAIVDTDTYRVPINFPFWWKVWPYDKVLDQGTPIIQVIPFKRESWSMDISVGDQEFSDEQVKLRARISAQYRHYKKEHHHKKVWQ